jgi:hypothetical protein
LMHPAPFPPARRPLWHFPSRNLVFAAKHVRAHSTRRAPGTDDDTPRAHTHINTSCRWGCVQCTNSTHMRWGGCCHKRRKAASCITLRPSIKGTQLLCLSRSLLSPCRCPSLPALWPSPPARRSPAFPSLDPRQSLHSRHSSARAPRPSSALAPRHRHAAREYLSL